MLRDHQSSEWVVVGLSVWHCRVHNCCNACRKQYVYNVPSGNYNRHARLSGRFRARRSPCSSSNGTKSYTCTEPSESPTMMSTRRWTRSMESPAVFAGDTSGDMASMPGNSLLTDRCHAHKTTFVSEEPTGIGGSVTAPQPMRQDAPFRVTFLSKGLMQPLGDATVPHHNAATPHAPDIMPNAASHGIQQTPRCITVYSTQKTAQ
jgi:hypothetical protein